MDPGRVQFFLGEVARNVTRNLVMQVTAVGTVAVTLFLLGTFLYARATFSAVGDDVLRKIEISVFLTDATTAARARAIARDVRLDPRVSSVVYVPRATGLAQMRDRLRGQIDTSLLTSNPLPDALRVRVRDPGDVHGVAATVRDARGVATVEYAQDAVQKLLQLSSVLGRAGLAVVALLVLVAAIIISNTIRLTVFARRREIAIMQLVGASGTYIRMPFICEGVLDGVLGAGVALGLLAVARAQLVPKLELALPFLPLHAASLDAARLALEMLATGAALGAVAAWISVGRYLRA